MADCTATPLLSYYFVCARARASRERNERLRQESDRLDAVFKPVNMKRLEMLKKQYTAALQSQQARKREKPILQSNVIKLSISSSSEEDTQHSTTSLKSDSAESSMEDEEEESETETTRDLILPSSASLYSSVRQTSLASSSLPFSLPSTKVSMPLPISAVPVVSVESSTISPVSAAASPLLSTAPPLSTIMRPSELPTLSSFAVAPMTPSTVTPSLPIVTSVVLSTVTPLSTVIPPVSTLFDTPSSTIAPMSTASISIVSSSVVSMPTTSILPTTTVVSSISPMASTPVSIIPLASAVVSSVPIPLMSANAPTSSGLSFSLSQSSSSSPVIEPVLDVREPVVPAVTSFDDNNHHLASNEIKEKADVNEMKDDNSSTTSLDQEEQQPQATTDDSESDFWDIPSTAVPVMDQFQAHQLNDAPPPNTGILKSDNINQPVIDIAADNASQHKASNSQSNSQLGSTVSVDYYPKNATMAAFSLLHTINAQIRRDHRLAKALYQMPKVNNMESSIKHSSVLNSLLTKRAELGKDMMTWDSATLGSVLVTSLTEVVAKHGPPPLRNDQKMSQADDDDEGWSSLFPLLLEHVRLLFQCGTFLEQLAQVFSPILQTEKAKLLTFFQKECGAEEIFSSSSISSLSQEIEVEEHKKQSAYHSLLQSSIHSDVSDSLSEDSAVLALQVNKGAGISKSKPFGGVDVIGAFGGVGQDERDEGSLDGSLPLPASPTQPSHPPPHHLEPQQSFPSSTSLKQRRSGISGKPNPSTLQKRMGQHEGDDIISSPLSGPSFNNSDDDFDFYN